MAQPHYTTFSEKSQGYVGTPSYNFFGFLIKYIYVGKSTELNLLIGGINLTVNDAVAKRISKLLREKDMSQYRLEQESGIQHGSMQCIMNGRNKTVTLSTVIMLARGFNMPLTEFLDDDIFRSEDLEVEQ